MKKQIEKAAVNPEFKMKFLKSKNYSNSEITEILKVQTKSSDLDPTATATEASVRFPNPRK